MGIKLFNLYLYVLYTYSRHFILPNKIKQSKQYKIKC